MPRPYKIYTSVTGTGPFSYSNILFITGTPVSGQINVYKNDVKLIQGVTLIDGDYTVQETAQTVTLRDALISSDTLEIRRETDDLQRLTLFTDGARLSASTLNKSLDQLFFLIQEKSLYSTSLEEFPSSLINISGITNRDTITWEAAQQVFVPSQLDVSLNNLNDVSYDAGTVVVSQLLGWNGTYWTPLTNISFDSTANITFTGDCAFSNPVTIVPGSGSSHAVNRGQLDAIVQSHSDTYTQGLQNRITALEESSMEILGKGRYWNTQGNYYPKLKPNTGSTFPVFDTSAGQVDYENLYNVSCVSASYVPYAITAHCESHASPNSTLLGDWIAWDTFTWDFQFENTLIIDDNSRSNVDSNQYHVIVDVDGKSDEWTSVTRGNSFNYVNYYDEDLIPQSSGSTPADGTHMDMTDNWPFYMNLNSFVGGKPWGSDVQTVSHTIGPLGGTATSYVQAFKSGSSHYYQNHNDNFDYEAVSDEISNHLEDRKSGMGQITEPMTLFGVFNKTQTGFSIMYAIKRPLHWRHQTSSSVAYWVPMMFLYKHSANQGNNDPPDGGGSQYSGHPLMEDFNFRFTIIQ